MSSILLYHHLGLGDHIMCHGIVREYCKRYNKVTIFCYPHNRPTVSFMYRDLNNLEIITGDDAFARVTITQESQKNTYDEIKVIGFENLDRTTGVPLEWQFYRIAGVPFKKKWESFFIERDLKKEQELFKKVDPKTDYAFIHDDPERGYGIDRDLIDKNYVHIIPDRALTENIIDYCTVVEKAKEIHVIDSSFMFLIDCLPYENPNQKLYIHRYARDNNEWQLPILKKDWHIFIAPHNKWEPIKDLLEWFSNREIPLLGKTFTKRAVRKIFTFMGWSMMRPKHSDIRALIARHVPDKSFLAISPMQNEVDLYITTAKKTGAASTQHSLLESATPADVVFYAMTLPQTIDLPLSLKKLRTVVNDILILHMTGSGTEAIEPLLEDTGFSMRERHLFPKESVLVCKAVSVPKTK